MSSQISATPAALLELTVILPVFNEVENLPLLWPELTVSWTHTGVTSRSSSSTI